MHDFITKLEENNEIVRIKTFVDPLLEITEVADRISKQYGPALLFENTQTDFPLLINALGTYERMCLALNVKNLDDITKEIETLFKDLSTPKQGWIDKLKMLPKLGKVASYLPKETKRKGRCQEVIMYEPDLSKFPILKCWPNDGGRFLTLPIIHTLDPVTGQRNVGLYRMQVFDKNLTALHWHKHKVSARHFNEYKKQNKIMPVAVALGGDPIYTYCATAPLPDGIDEYILAGFLRKKKVELVKCLTQDMYVPSDADIIIEGYVDPNEDFILEGPFGDHTGFYSLADYYPKFHITCITHRKDAVYPATIVGIPPQEDAWIGKATERIFLAPLKMTMVQEIVDMNLPIEGVFHNLAIVKIKKEYAGQGIKVMNSLWGAGQMMFTKILIVVDGDVDIHNQKETAQYVSKHFRPDQDAIFTQGPVDVLDHSCSAMSFGGKIGIDATKKLEEEKIHNPPTEVEIDIEAIKNELTTYDEIRSTYTQLLEENISMIFVGIEKNRKNHIKDLHRALCSKGVLKGIKIVGYVEPQFDIEDVTNVVWRFCNNLDPKRDGYLFESESNFSTLGLDGTRKTKEFDNFVRDWPNILTSDMKTIESIDTKWKELNIGDFIPSPSRKHLLEKYPGGAVAE